MMISGDGHYSDSQAPSAAEDDAFIDLNDPNNEILDETNMAAIDASDAYDDSSSEDEQSSASAQAVTRKHAKSSGTATQNEEQEHGSDDTRERLTQQRHTEFGQEENDKDNEEEGEGVEDLNKVPDHEPDHDDAVAVFIAKDRQPVHSVTAHPHQPHLIAAAGESEEVYILQLVCAGSGTCPSIPLQSRDERNNSIPYNMSTANNDSSCDNYPTQLQRGSEPGATVHGSVTHQHETASWTVLHTLRAHTDTVSVLSFSPNGSYLASAGLDSTVCVWRVEDGSCLHTLRDLYGEILTLLWHPSSLVLVASADDAQAAMWNVLRGTLVNYFVGHRGAVTATRWSPDHKRLITGSADGTVCEYNPRTGVVERSVSKDLSESAAAVTAMCFTSADSCVVGCEDGTMHVVIFAASDQSHTAMTNSASARNANAHSGDSVISKSSYDSGSNSSAARVARHLEELHEQAIETLALNRYGTLLLSTSCDCRVIVWSVPDYHPRVVLQVGESVIPAMWLGGYGVVAGCSDGSVRVWDGRDSTQSPRYVLSGHRRMILSLGMLVGGECRGCDEVAVERGTEGMPMAESYRIISSSDDGTVRAFPPIVV